MRRLFFGRSLTDDLLRRALLPTRHDLLIADPQAPRLLEPTLSHRVLSGVDFARPGSDETIVIRNPPPPVLDLPRFDFRPIPPTRIASEWRPAPSPRTVSTAEVQRRRTKNRAARQSRRVNRKRGAR